MSTNCQKLDIFFKKIAKNCHFFPQISKCQVFGNLLTFKWQFSGGSACKYMNVPCVSDYVLVELVLVHTQTNNYGKAVQRCEKALSISISEPKLSAVVFQNLGAVYNHLKQFQIAIGFHVKAAERHGRSTCYIHLCTSK